MDWCVWGKMPILRCVESRVFLGCEGGESGGVVIVRVTLIFGVRVCGRFERDYKVKSLKEIQKIEDPSLGSRSRWLE